MHIALLGMSGVGKTHWANRLTHSGFECFHCDDLIAAQLQQQTGQTLTTVYDLGAWMGLPGEAGFGDRERTYLELENQTIAHISDRLAYSDFNGHNLVVDLTGSAIYVAAETLANLRQRVRFVYLAITPAVQAQMLAEYLRCPRPLIWRGLYHQEPYEERAAALQRCYAKLIAYREARYERLCEVKLEYSLHRKPGLTVANFLQAIQK